MASFEIEAMVRGYHIYKDVWSAVIDEEFPCKREDGNRFDPFAVAVCNSDMVIRHVPRKISSVCSLYIRRGGEIHCRVTGSRRFSADLEQGGLEVPCLLIFQSDNSSYSLKAKKLLETALGNIATDVMPSKKRKLSNKAPEKKGELTADNNHQTSEPTDSVQWVKFGGIELSKADKDEILQGMKLDDHTVNMAQSLLKCQFPEIAGLRSTLLQTKEQPKGGSDTNKLQIVHSRGDHWIVASTILATKDEVNLYDSVYRTVDRNTNKIIKNLFPSSPSIELVRINGQTGGKDCGVFAIALSTAILNGKDPSSIKFNQLALRPHLIDCLEKGKLSPFPTLS